MRESAGSAAGLAAADSAGHSSATSAAALAATSGAAALAASTGAAALKSAQSASALTQPTPPSPPAQAKAETDADAVQAQGAVNLAGDDRDDILVGDKVLLIVENDAAFADILLQAARRHGFKGLVSNSGAGALALTRDHPPALITLDIHLPDMQGWRILERLKSDPATRHVPVCVVSTDDSRQRALHCGAFSFLSKPLQSIDQVDQALAQLGEFSQRQRKRLLVMLAGSAQRAEYLEALDSHTEVALADSAAAARLEIAAGAVDCLITDGSALDFGPEDVIEVIEALDDDSLSRPLPIVLASADSKTVAIWERGHSAFALRRATTLEQLLDATAFFLHRGVEQMSEPQRRAANSLHHADRTLQGKKVLIVDDDMRNIFALAALLDAQGMRITSAENGLDAIRKVETDPAIDIVLMDIMMPEMDGMETMRRLRQLPRGKELPLIAVTAKAMKGDREKCIEAGAWDYLSKPVDTAYLLVVLRGWLCQ